MAFDINEFSARINRRGHAVSNLFVARITPPRLLVAGGDPLGEDLVFFCRSVEIPGIDINTVPYRVQGYGTPQPRPVGMEFPVLPTVFMIDSEFAIMKFFHRWTQMVYNYDTSAGPLAAVPGSAPDRSQGIWQLGYRDDYIGQMEVIQYSQNSDHPALKYEYHFGNIFPSSIGGVQLAWENGGEIMVLPVSFSYDAFKPSGSVEGTVTTDFNRGNGLLNYLSAINTFGQAIRQIDRPRSIQDLVNQNTRVNTILNSF